MTEKIRKNVYTIESRVRFSEIDHTGKISLPAIINYFQDCSIFQSEKLGYGVQYLEGQKKAWVLSSWQISIERYPNIGEKISVGTFATHFKGICGERNFYMKDESGNFVACADSLWVYMDLAKGRPTKPQQDEITAYGVAEPLEMDHEPRKIKLPENKVEYPEYPVRKYQIDTNEHVNNSQYILMAQEMLPEGRKIKKMRAEYKKSAVYKDVIVPYAAEEGNRTVIELCDKHGAQYAVVEFK